MQRFLLAVLSTSLCFLTSCAPKTSSLPPAPPASDFKTQIAFETQIEADGVVIVKFFDRRAKSVVVPAQIDGRPVQTIGERAFAGCESLTSVAIPASVQIIGEHAFDGCESLTSVAIPASVQTIGEHAFDDCESLTSLSVAPGNKRFKSVDGVLFTADGQTLIAFPAGKKATEYQIPDGVKAFGGSAFWGCESLTSLVIPYGVETLDEGMFIGCDSLTSVVIPESVQIIGDSAFWGCESLAWVAIPYGVETIGESAFECCQSLTLVAIPASVQKIGIDAFNSCSPDLSIYGTVGSVAEEYAAQNGLRFEALEKLEAR